MSAAWWPEGAPVPAQRIGELTSRELAELTRFAEHAPALAGDGARLVQFLGELRAEAAERRELLASITANAKAATTTSINRTHRETIDS